jgi:pimeloyl-ACP methyl ester carboxylesterase
MGLEELTQVGVGFLAGAETIRKDRPTLIMIHGAGGCAQIWQNQIRPLNEVVNTLALDLPGHGETGGSGTPSIHSYAQWLGEIIENRLQTPVFLMGHSMGGAVVQESALQFPQLLKGIVLVSTGLRLQVAPAFLDGFLNNFDQTIDMVMQFAYAPGADGTLVEQGAQLMKAAGKEVVHADFLACDRFDRRQDMGGMDLPCAILCGDQDKLTPPSLSEKLHHAIRGSSLTIVPSAGHMVMIENHKAFNQEVSRFLSAHPH